MKQLTSLIVLMLVWAFNSLHAQSPSSGSRPDLFRYQQVERSMIKLDVLNLLYQVDRRGISGQISLGYEQKIGTALSLNTALGTSYQLLFDASPASSAFRLTNGSISLTVEPRYYYSMNKRVRTQQGAANLSGNYLGLQGSTQLLFFRNDARILGEKGVYVFHGFSLTPVYGIQRRLGKFAFIDFSLGLRFLPDRMEQARLHIRTPDEARWIPRPVTSLRLGLAF